MHDDRIKCLDHLMVYHVGEKALVEMHVVLDEHLPLKVTHDLTEDLQRKIQALDFVDRVKLPSMQQPYMPSLQRIFRCSSTLTTDATATLTGNDE